MNPTSDPATELPAKGFLADVSSEHRSFLACFGKFLRPESGEILIQKGDPQDALYVILAGTLHIVSPVEDRPMFLGSLGEGDSLGEVNLFDPATASATAVTRTPCLIWTLTRDEFEGFLAADPAAGLSVLKGLLQQFARRMRGLNEKVTSAEQRASLHQFWTSDFK